jgi:hypothetical protein
LLSFSCAPLLKQHILRTLSMTNEELASLEPIIAQAWDQWDHQVLSSLSSATLSHLSLFSPLSIQLQRRIHYAQQAQVAASAGKPPDGHPLGGPPPPPPPPPATFAAAVELGDAQAAGQPYPTADPSQQQQQQQQRPPPPPPPQNDFRARFHRSLVAPSPFGTFAPPPPPPPPAAQPGAPADGIDPHLGATDQSPKVAAAAVAAAIDPELGQVQDEAEVVRRLERG